MGRKSLFFGLAVLLAAASGPVRAGSDNPNVIQGGGTSIVTGGTGSPTFAPVKTSFAFHWEDGAGKFECLAVIPSAAAPLPGSGTFDANAMYVTGNVTSARIQGSLATLTGLATVTGLGAGTNVPFTATAKAGGPGTTLVLSISGLVFNEIVLEGAIEF
jgi:hypothetical protein